MNCRAVHLAWGALCVLLCAVLFVLWHLFLAVSMITGWLSDQCQNLLHDLGEMR